MKLNNYNSDRLYSIITFLLCPFFYRRYKLSTLICLHGEWYDIINEIVLFFLRGRSMARWLRFAGFFVRLTMMLLWFSAFCVLQNKQFEQKFKRLLFLMILITFWLLLLLYLYIYSSNNISETVIVNKSPKLFWFFF